MTETVIARDVEDNLREVTVSAERKRSFLASDRITSDKAPEPVKPILIDSESVKVFVQELDLGSVPTSEASENGAIIMDQKLLQRLNQSVRRIGNISIKENYSAHSDFKGGNWTDYVRLGDFCFRVTQANPLEPLSQDVWYRVKCT